MEIQVQHIGPDLQFATAQVEKYQARSRARSQAFFIGARLRPGSYSRLKILLSRSQLRVHSEETDRRTERSWGCGSSWPTSSSIARGRTKAAALDRSRFVALRSRAAERA